MTTRLDQLRESEMNHLLSFLPLADRENISQVSTTARQVFHSAHYRENNGYSLKEYVHFSLPAQPDQSLIDALTFENESYRMDDGIATLSRDCYRKKKKGGIEVLRSAGNSLSVVNSSRNQTLSFAQDEVIYDFAIQASQGVVAVSTSKGLQIYALEDGNSKTPHKVAEFCRFQFRTFSFHEDDILIGYEPQEGVLKYSWNMTALSFSSPKRTTHLLDNPALYALKETARKIGLFFLRSLTYFAICVAAVAILALLVAAVATLIHAVAPVTALGLGAGAFFVQCLIAGGVIGGVVLTPCLLGSFIRSAIIAFRKPILDGNILFP
jgi:hypothetical protein